MTVSDDEGEKILFAVILDDDSLICVAEEDRRKTLRGRINDIHLYMVHQETPFQRFQIIGQNTPI
jgi:hypothetical protein